MEDQRESSSLHQSDATGILAPDPLEDGSLIYEALSSPDHTSMEQLLNVLRSTINQFSTATPQPTMREVSGVSDPLRTAHSTAQKARTKDYEDAKTHSLEGNLKLDELNKEVVTVRHENLQLSSKLRVANEWKDDLSRRLVAAEEEIHQLSSKLREANEEVSRLKELLRDAPRDTSKLRAIVDDLRSQLQPAYGAIDIQPPSPSDTTSQSGASKSTSAIAFTPGKNLSKRPALSFRASVPQAPNKPYPDDASRVGCVRINILEVEQGIWDIDVPQCPEKRVREYLEWSAMRTKNYAIPKADALDLSNLQCHWHQIARHPFEKICEWHVDGQGEIYHHHACLTCESRRSLCSVLESEGVLVLLPLAPSARKDRRPDLSPEDISYWVNGG